MLPMTLTKYLDLEQQTVQATRKRFLGYIELLDELAAFFERIAQSVRNTRQATIDDRFVEICLFHDARRFWLNGCATWARQHLTECFPAMRSALEAAACARKISLNPGLNIVWLSPDLRRKEFNAAFRDGGIEKQLFPETDRLARRLWSLFDLASTYGVHVNYERLALSLEVVRDDLKKPHEVRFFFGVTEEAPMKQGGIFCLNVGVRIIEVFERVLEDVTGQSVWMQEWPMLGGRVLKFTKAELTKLRTVRAAQSKAS